MKSSISTYNTESSSPFGEFGFVRRHQEWNSAYIKQQMHEKRIDEFFLTDIEAPKKRKSVYALLGSLLGSVAPVIYFARKQHPDFKLNPLKNFKKVFDVTYDLKQILASGLGGLFGGLAGGLADRQEKYKLQKMEEASFQFMNIIFPSVLVNKSIKLCETKKYLNSPFAKIASTVASLFVGSSCAVAISNRVDKKIFDKYNHEQDRQFKKKDLLVHVDDLLGSLVLAKFPYADKLHINKFLPAIYSWNGFKIGDS